MADCFLKTGWAQTGPGPVQRQEQVGDGSQEYSPQALVAVKLWVGITTHR